MYITYLYVYFEDMRDLPVSAEHGRSQGWGRGRCQGQCRVLGQVQVQGPVEMKQLQDLQESTARQNRIEGAQEERIPREQKPFKEQLVACRDQQQVYREQLAAYKNQLGA